ncbi:alpha N-terminal methyltransferase 1 [Micractinium conductrix]|uniref:Alpha N-terminal protein methyltransferase 1 n=1 Tax=Micractinium conductrix TaxID=554055 RepID=A0A2P6V3U0_9CHLO|nr:alpha N-terminal methyltransferase 1 [Micractinium conductrix]|eukprot:PSC68762.1 alpha N-terminal methyltransferase 1 [Micractinium conductrix]
MEAAGVDDEGNVFSTPAELWERAEEAQWYTKAVDYWDQQEASDDGVLGGYGHLSAADVRDSRAFLRKAFGSALSEAEAGQQQLAALDCGAGVGRVSEQLLLHHFHEVDLVEPSAHLVVEARRRLGERSPAGVPRGHKAVNFFQEGIEQHRPPENRYDVIWLQWAALYLTDDDLIAFLQRSAAALKPGGVLIVKENVCEKGFVVDNSDASVTRSHQYYVQLFEQAGMRMTHTALQKDFPKGLFKVRMYALKGRS